ncbi:MAG: dihydrolipoyl dehydrogenase [Bacteroidetes bacterium]|nr:dihydrolipoyl dehydrogenase [Bacteroidota bacterium]
MTNQFDLIVIGSGPGGYVAAIRASQLGMKVAVIEKESLGGVCLNWGCIPTKALLKSAQVWNYINKAEDYGFNVNKSKIDFDKVIKRSRNVANDMSKGVNFLLNKNKITIIKGFAKLEANNIISVEEHNKKTEYNAKHIIIATGARSRELPNLKIDNEKIIGYRKAMVLKTIPKSMVIVGAGAIGCEFAYFYNSMGTKVTLIEYMENIVPLEDQDISNQLKRSFTKLGIDVLTNTEVLKVEANKKECKIFYKEKDSKNEKTLKAEIVLSAAGITPNIENIGLEKIGIEIEKGKIKVDEYYKTNINNIYAIGDVINGPALAHVASSEGILCVEAISNLNPEPLNYNNMPNCTYCDPEVASVGHNEKSAKEAGYDILIGKFPFSASGKANAAGTKEGFIKVIFDSKYGEWLGAHMIGSNVTELIAEIVVARKLETTGHEIIKATHPHPTLSESVMEAVANAYNECIHL